MEKKPKSKLRRAALSVLRISAGVYLGLIAFLFFFQPSFIYRPVKEIINTPDEVGLNYESVDFKSTDGVQLSGWFVPGPESAPIILFCHSNTGNISYYLDTVGMLHRSGYGVFIFDYRGYGQSGGKTTEPGTYLDAEAAWRHLTETRKIPPRDIVILARSLGGAIGSRLAVKHSPKALILESAFTRFSDIAAVHFPYLPVRLITRFDYNVIQNIRQAGCPVLIVHSREDEIVPFGHGLRLFEAANEPKEFLEISGTHNECYFTSGERYVNGFRDFISRHSK